MYKHDMSLTNRDGIYLKNFGITVKILFQKKMSIR